MQTRYLRLLLVALILVTLFLVDAWMNVKTRLGSGLLTGIGFAVAFHVLAFEAVFSKSKPLTFATWTLVTVFSGISFFLLNNPLDFFIVVVFFVAYTALLLLYLKRKSKG